ncbi:Universal stress protein UspA [uncultured Gammaproteobacteria bacterium]
MAVKDILVHLDGSERSRTRLEIAIRLAVRHQARLTGMFARVEHSSPSVVARKASEWLQRMADEAEAQFNTLTGTAGIEVRWRALPFGEYNYVIREMIISARYCDFVILGQTDPDDPDDNLPEELPEQVVLHSGRPVLMIPYVGAFPTLGQNAIVAWNAEREAVRALNDGLFLLADAAKVTVFTITGSGNSPNMDDVPKLDITDHLTCHGIKASVDHISLGDGNYMDLILSRAADISADLLVMGAHGHYEFPYLYRGAGTRYILRHMTLPVLMSH